MIFCFGYEQFMLIDAKKECVARMTCLYKNNGAVSFVGGSV